MALLYGQFQQKSIEEGHSGKLAAFRYFSHKTGFFPDFFCGKIDKMNVT